MSIKLTRKKFSVQLPDSAIASLTGHSILNTVPMSEMAFLILHNWLEEHHGELVEHYEQLSREASKGISAVEHQILGEYKRRAASLNESTVSQITLSLPIYDNRRLIGHAHKRNVSKAEMARQILVPWLEEHQGTIDRFYERAAAWMEIGIDEAREQLMEEFKKASR
ncbi:MAG: hypothetical protein F6J86_37800 [Symploca sp. SIO1B1]|nr:hypothetical protein [Symploca sp. SIO1A3]NER99509.1 hypothetical protein [Symploca sp. SIO1B1]